jgi:hypothetical protein
MKMRIPFEMPTRADDERMPRAVNATDALSSSTERALVEPAACCAEACVTILGQRICHCVLELPVCP